MALEEEEVEVYFNGVFLQSIRLRRATTVRMSCAKLIIIIMQYYINRR